MVVPLESPSSGIVEAFDVVLSPLVIAGAVCEVLTASTGTLLIRAKPELMLDWSFLDARLEECTDEGTEDRTEEGRLELGEGQFALLLPGRECGRVGLRLEEMDDLSASGMIRPNNDTMNPEVPAVLQGNMYQCMTKQKRVSHVFSWSEYGPIISRTWENEQVNRTHQ